MYQGQPTEYAYSLVGVESVPSCDKQHCTMANAYPLDQLGGIVARFRPRLIKTNELPGRLVAWLVTMYRSKLILKIARQLRLGPK